MPNFPVPVDNSEKKRERSFLVKFQQVTIGTTFCLERTDTEERLFLRPLSTLTSKTDKYFYKLKCINITWIFFRSISYPPNRVYAFVGIAAVKLAGHFSTILFVLSLDQKYPRWTTLSKRSSSAGSIQCMWVSQSPGMWYFICAHQQEYINIYDINYSGQHPSCSSVWHTG